MKNIFAVFVTDFKRIKGNVVAVVIILGLSIIPSLYAWFNILSNWDPYGADATSKIKVAVASDDQGAEIQGLYFNMGDSVTEALESNTSIGWVFTDTTQDAIDGVYSGDYYAALVMPDDFTENLISFLSEDMKHPEIIYYENEKKNAIAPKITAKAKTAVQQQVNATFISTLAEVMTKAVGEVMNTEALQNMGVTNADNLVDVVINKLEYANSQLDTFEAIVDSFISVVAVVDATGDIANELETDKVISQSQGAIAQTQGTLNSGLAAKLPVARSLSASLGSIQSLLKSVSDVYDELQGDVEKFDESLEDMGVNLFQTKELITDMRKNLQESIDSLYELKDSDSYQMLMELLEADSEAIGSFMAAPVEIETQRVFPISNYGSAMAPFYSVLAIWVGSLILVAIIHVAVKPINGVPVKLNDAYVGRYITFFLIGQMQALLTLLGDMFFVEIQCEEPFKMWLAASMASFVFTIIIYSLTFAFGNIGEALAVVIMVIQVAGAGGTFPKEVLPEVYQNVYKFLPFPYAMDAMREAVGGLYDTYYWNCIGHLLLYVPISVIIGLVGGKAFEKMNHLIEKNKEKSGVMI